MRGTQLGRLSLLVCLLLVNGCGDGKARRHGISGSVRFQERPLDEGSILFIPKSPELSESGARIRQGEYRVPKDHGLAPGIYEVRITSGERGTDIRKEMDPEQAGGEPYPIARERIPERYNKKSELTIKLVPFVRLCLLIPAVVADVVVASPRPAIALAIKRQSPFVPSTSASTGTCGAATHAASSLIV